MDAMHCHPNTSWNISHELALEYMYNTHEQIQVTVILPVLLAIGFIGNFGFLLVLLRLDYMRTITNLYLGNLALADLSYISSMAVLRIWAFIVSPVELNQPYQSSVGCLIFYFVKYVSVFSSYGFVTWQSETKRRSLFYSLCQLRVLKHTECNTLQL